MNKLQENLTTCYDAQASHFHHTRGFHKRPELEFIKPYLDKQSDCHPLPSGEGLGVRVDENTNHEGRSFLDLGCGSGRISGRLAQAGYTHTYTGVDISGGMINTAKQHYPEATFHCAGMVEYTQSLEQQSQDIVLCLASFHHLTTQEERLLTLHNMYRSLRYGGTLILINRSFSQWFLEKYRRSGCKALGYSLATLGNRKRNDLLIPRKDPQFQENKKIYQRYYHMFTLGELKKLVGCTDFQLEHLSFINQAGEVTSSWRDSRNSVCVLRK